MKKSFKLYFLLLLFSFTGCSFFVKSEKVIDIREFESLLENNIKDIKDIENLFAKTPEGLNKRVEYTIEVITSDINNFLNIKSEERTFDNTARFYDNINSKLSVAINSIEILQANSPDDRVRQAATIGCEKLRKFSIDSFCNKKIYRAFKAYQGSNNYKKENLNLEEKFFLKELNKEFKKEGFELDDQKFQEVNDLRKELAKLSLDFESNVNQDKSELRLKKDELEGLSEDFIKSLDYNNNYYILKANVPTAVEILQNCSVTLTREKFYKIFNNRAYPANLEILKTIINKRELLAQKLGFKSYAHLDLDEEMAKKPEIVDKFLLDIVKKSKNKANKELKLLFPELKNQKINPWDYKYILEEYKKKYFNINERELSEYFSVQDTLEKIFEIYQKFLNLEFKFSKIETLWSPDLFLLKIFDKDTKELKGLMVLDLYVRANKYPGACMANISNNIKYKDINKIPLLVIVANFPKKMGNNPALLKFYDVETFFHEFGHAMHHVLGQTELNAFSGTHTKTDFVEMPSQMFEEWFYDRDILKFLSKHYKTGANLPDEIIDKKIELKKFDSGYFYTRQIILSLISLYIYLPGQNKDTDKIIKELWQKYLPEIYFDEQTHFQTSFSHLTGYSAKYYSYLWSKVFSLDLFNEIKKMGLLNPEAGKLLINKVLSKGGSVEPDILLKDFLGREPNQEAFFKDIGF